MTLQDARVETVIVDNDRKAHSKIVRDAWARFGIKVWPMAGVVGDRTLISEFTGESAENLGGFPVNSPDCMTNDQSVINSWENFSSRTLRHIQQTLVLAEDQWWLHQ